MTLTVKEYDSTGVLLQAKESAEDYLAKLRQAENKKYQDFPLHPTDYECAYFSNVVYQTDFGINELLPGWQLIRSGQDKDSGYEGAVYWQTLRRQLVIAHRGTDRKDNKDIRMDVNTIARGNVGEQMVAARTFVFDTLIKLNQLNPVSITMTGHSLGGWLAQVATFHVEEAVVKNEQKNINQVSPMRARAVVFESPGCERMLEDISAKYEPLVALQRLDITTYLSAPNLVNTANPHLGTLYQCRFDFQPPKGLKDLARYTEETHSMPAMLAMFDKQTGKPKDVKRMRAWPLTTWLDGNKRSLTTIAILGVLKDYLAKTDTKQLVSFNQLAQDIKTTNIQDGSLLAKQAYQLQYDAQYYPVEEQTNINAWIIKTTAFSEANVTFLNRYLEVKQVLGEKGIELLYQRFIQQNLTQLPELLEGLTLEAIPNSSAKILRSPKVKELAHYLLHTRLVYPNFFHQGFELFEELLKQIKTQAPSTQSIAASLIGKAQNVTITSVHDKGVSVPDTIAPVFFEKLLDKYLSKIEAASTIPLVGEVTGQAEIGPVERTKLYMYGTKPETKKEANVSQSIGKGIYLAAGKVILDATEIPDDKKGAVFVLMEQYADDNCQQDEQITRNRKGQIRELDLGNSTLANALVTKLCNILDVPLPLLNLETNEKKALGSNLK